MPKLRLSLLVALLSSCAPDFRVYDTLSYAACGDPVDASEPDLEPDLSPDTTPDLSPDTTPDASPTCPAITAGQNTNFYVGGQLRSFYVATPLASFTGPRPLLFVWHGTGCSGSGVVQGTSGGCGYALSAWTNKGFLVVAPDSNGNGAPWPVWDSFNPTTVPSPPHVNADDALFDELVPCIQSHFSVDASRIYTAGHSAGAAMANHTLGRRSDLLAGGITASGMVDFTKQLPAVSIAPMLVITTWGGTNDFYSGSAGGVPVQGYLVEEAAVTSQYWEAQPGMHGIACSGPNYGHQWLRGINAWLADRLLEHPKGSAVLPGETLPATGVSGYICTEAPATYTPPVAISCSTYSTPGCQQYCQLHGDCIIENGTLGQSMSSTLVAWGWTAGSISCSSCESTCAADAAGSAADTSFLACIAASAPTTSCGQGVEGGGAGLLAVDACCDANPGSHICTRFCNAYTTSFWYGMIGACH